MVLTLASCSGAAPRAVVLHEDQCAYCRMEVGDARFAGESITNKGRVHVFDSIDCLAGYARGAEPGAVRSLWVTDAEHPGTFVAAAAAGYLLDSDLRGPMGRAVAFASPAAARAAQGTHGGTPADWTAVLADTTSHTLSAGRR